MSGTSNAKCGRWMALNLALRHSDSGSQQAEDPPEAGGLSYNSRRMMPPRAILAAVSFSESSRVALVLAARLARHCGAELHVLSVEDPLLDAAARYEGIDLAAETYAELQRFVAGAWPAAQCSPQTHVLAGAAVDVIL